MISLSRLPRFKKVVKVALALLIVGVTALCLIPGPDRSGATISITPNNLLNQAGQTWTAKVFVQTNQPINSVDTTIHFDPSLVEVKDIDNSDSAFEMKVFEPTLNQSQATVRFVQTSLQSYDDQQALVGTITFKGIKQGQLHLTPQQTKIVADDGQGTDLFHPVLSQSLGQWLLTMVKL